MEASIAVLEPPISPEIEGKSFTYLRLESNSQSVEAKSAKKMVDVINVVNLWSFLRAEQLTMPHYPVTSTEDKKPMDDLNAEEAASTTLQDLNAEIDIVTTLLIKATLASSALSKNSTDESIASNMAQIKEIMEERDVITSFQDRPLRFPPDVHNLYISLKQKMEASENDYSLPFNGNEIPVIPRSIHINKRRELGKFLDTVARRTHEIRRPISPLKMVLQLTQRKLKERYEQNRPAILGGYQKIHKAITDEIELMSQNILQKEEANSTYFDIKKIWLDKVMDTLTSRNFNPDKIRLTFAENLPEKISLPIQPSLLGEVIDNIAVNCANAYDGKDIQDNRNFKMSIQMSKDGAFLEIVCSNDGTEYPAGIVKNGFITAREQGIHGYGSREVPSTGYKMATCTEDLREIGGNLIPDNVKDAEGNIVGAETIIRIPI